MSVDRRTGSYGCDILFILFFSERTSGAEGRHTELYRSACGGFCIGSAAGGKYDCYAGVGRRSDFRIYIVERNYTEKGREGKEC